MSYARRTIKGLLERARCGEKIGDGKVFVAIAADYSAGELLSTADGNTNEVAAMIALYIKKLNIKEKVDRAFKYMSEDSEISQLLLEG